MATTVNNLATIMSKKTRNLECINCGFISSSKNDYNRHIETKKHKMSNQSTFGNKTSFFTQNQESVLLEKTNTQNECKICNKTFGTRSGLWRHNKKLHTQEETPLSENMMKNDLCEKFDFQAIFMDIVKQNEEFKQLLIEQNKQNQELQKQVVEIASTTNSNITNNYNNNTMNNKFNLQIFLNETCKDAMNIQEFIDYVTVQHSDFENFGKMGYVEALTRIFLRNLTELEVHRRPIHCSDLKREVLYVKDNDVWTSDVSREKLIRTIKYIANKNVKQIPGWMDKNPDSKNTQTKLHDKYMRMLCFSMGAKTEEEDQEYYKKIIRNVSKEVCIDKAL